MKLTRASDYAVRILRALSIAKNEGTTSADLALKLNIPVNHIAKVVNKLSRNRFIISKKGKGGGVWLARTPGSIKISEIIETMEGPIMLSDCLFISGVCEFSKTCKFRKNLAKINNSINGLFSNLSVKDLCN